MGFVDGIMSRKKNMKELVKAGVGTRPKLKSPTTKAEPVADTSHRKTFYCKCGYEFTVDVSKFSQIICPWCARVQK